jgi:2-methylisocitrate lyase-like PEP mutase family enzyme
LLCRHLGLSETNLCWADVGFMGYGENLHASRAIAACMDILVSADADKGGNAISPGDEERARRAAAICE